MTQRITNEGGAWVDVTYPIEPAMPVWPGQPTVELDRLASIKKPGDASVSRLSCSVHIGTHVDAPNHFIADDQDITAMPLELMFGPVRVAIIPGEGHITAAAIDHYEQRAGQLEKGQRVLFRTRNSDRDWAQHPFDKTYAAVAPDAAELLVQRGVTLVGVDYLSVAPFEDPATTHRLLLHARVWIIEGLDLRDVEEGDYQMIAAPLKIVGSDASPLRVLLRKI